MNNRYLKEEEERKKKEEITSWSMCTKFNEK